MDTMHTANVAAGPDPNDLLTAQQASDLLGVKQATLYTYVSRGWLHAVRSPSRRDHRYQRDEVESLRLRSTARHGHGALAASAMRWGQPVMDTAITEIDDAGPHYRGYLASDLVNHPGVYENVAELLWSGVLTDTPHTWPVEPFHVDLAEALNAMLQSGRTKPRMLRLTGRLADGWLPSMGYADPDALGPMNATIDEAALAAYPYHERNFLRLFEPGWERRTGAT